VGARNLISIIDVFDMLKGTAEGGIVQPFVVVSVIRVYRKDRGKHTITIHCKDKDGMPLLTPIPDTYDLIEFPNESTLWCYTGNMGRAGLKIGTYHFSIVVDGKPLAHTPLYVVQEKT
jgi:hypothetical protein